MELATEVRWQDTRFSIPRERILASERWGYDAVFTAGDQHTSDALTPLGYIAAITNRIKLGTSIVAVTGRTPTATAMAFQTLEHLAGGNRVLIGLGASHPDYAEGFHGLKWGKPTRRMREFVEVVRRTNAGGVVEFQGNDYSIPYRGEDHLNATGKIPLLTTNPDIPIYLAAFGPQAVTQAGEIADGFLPTAFLPGMLQNAYGPLLEKGFARTGNGKGYKDFKIWAHLDMNVNNDVREAMRPFKQYVCTFQEFQLPLMESTGFAEAAATLRQIVEDRKLGDYHSIEDSVPIDDPMIDLVPDEYIDQGWLCGPTSRFAKLLEPWQESGATGLIVRYGPQLGEDRSGRGENLEAFRAVAKALDKPGSD